MSRPSTGLAIPPAMCPPCPAPPSPEGWRGELVGGLSRSLMGGCEYSIWRSLLPPPGAGPTTVLLQREREREGLKLMHKGYFGKALRVVVRVMNLWRHSCICGHVTCPGGIVVGPAPRTVGPPPIAPWRKTSIWSWPPRPPQPLRGVEVGLFPGLPLMLL